MTILFVTPSYVPAYHYGGPTVSVSMLARSLVAAGHAVTVYTTTANGDTELVVERGKPQMIDGVVVYYFKRITGDHSHVAPALWQQLYKTTAHFELIHIHSWWSILNFGTALICLFKKKRYLISPRGMLSRYSFQHQNSRKKSIVHALFGKHLLKHSWLHATSPQEWLECIAMSNGKGFTLPNIVNLPSITGYKKQGGEDDNITVGFLSRIDEKKGLDLLLNSIADSGVKLKLKIAGNGTDAYLKFLQGIIRSRKLESQVEWCGWMNSEQKFDFLKSIDLLALTSHNENFANVVIESMAIGTPVLISEHVGLAPYVKEKDLGWVCSIKRGSITQALIEVVQNKNRIVEKGRRAQAQVYQDFDSLGLAQKYINAYNAVLTANPA